MGDIGAPKERDRRPTLEEFETLFARFSSNRRDTLPMGRVVKFAIAAGMRLDETVRIEWKDVDAGTRTAVILSRKDPRKKDGNNQRVPLLDATRYDAMALLAEQRAAVGGKGQCFPYNGKSIGTAFRRTCEKAVIVDLH